MKTLLLVDVQNDFMPGGTLEVKEGDQIVSAINAVIEDYDLVVATVDWHPQNHMSFAVNHTDKKPFETIDLTGQKQTLWPAHCVQNTEGAAFHSNLRQHFIETIFRKGTNPELDSYSGFYDNMHQKSTGLAGYFKEKGVREFDICGLAGDICVYFTMKDALDEGFRVNLIQKATRALDQDVFKEQKAELMAKGVHYL